MEVIIDGVKYVPTPEVPTCMGLLEALELRFDSDAGDNQTVRDYLYCLLDTLWKEGETFSGKRPLGNSGWEYDLYRPLIAGGFIPGKVEDGSVVQIDDQVAYDYVRSLIAAAFYGVTGA